MKMATSQTAKNIQSAQPTIKLLETIDPKALLLRVRCEDCGNTFTHDVAFVLRMTRSTGFFIPSPLCRKCRSSKRKASPKATKKEVKKEVKKPVPQQTKKKKAKKIKPLPENKAPAETPKTNDDNVVGGDSVDLTHRPFAALEALKK